MKHNRSVNFSQSAGVKPLPFWNGETARSGYDWLAIFGWTDHRNVTQMVEQRVDHVCHRFKFCRSNEADFVTALFYGSKQKLKSRAKHCATQMPGDVRSTHPVPAHFRDKWERDVVAV